MSPRVIPLAVSAFTAAALVACSMRDDARTPLDPSGPAQAGKTPAVTDPTATFLFPLVDGGLGLRSDHVAAYDAGSSSRYADSECGIVAKIFATTAASNSGDATMQTDNPRTTDHSCASYPRKLTVDYGDGVVETTTVFLNLNKLQNTVSSIPINTTVLRGLNLTAKRCGGLRWKSVVNGVSTGAAEVRVTRTDSSTWEVASQLAPNDSVYCASDGRMYRIPVHFTIVASRPL